MRVVLQRCREASVRIEGEVVGAIGKGLVVLLGIEGRDTLEDVQYLVKKITEMRIFDDENGVMNKSIMDVGGELLLVSQFTLMASTKKGNRPSYIRASRPETAIPLYEAMQEELTKVMGQAPQTGRFGADMQVCLVNDGPVTIILDSHNKE